MTGELSSLQYFLMDVQDPAEGKGTPRVTVTEEGLRALKEEASS